MHYLTRSQTLEVELDNVLTPVPDTEQHYVADRLAARIAANAVAQVDELALIGYPSLDPATRATYETAIRLAARRVLES